MATAGRDTVIQSKHHRNQPATAAPLEAQRQPPGRWGCSSRSPGGLIFPTPTEEDAMKTAYAVKWHYADETPRQATETIVWALDVADAQQRFETDNRIEMVVSVQPT